MAQARWAHRGEVTKVYSLMKQRLVEEGTQEPPRPSTFSRLWGRCFGDAPILRFAVLEGEGKRLVGCMSLHRSISAKTGLPSVQVKDMFVLPEERRKGHAQALLAFAELHAARSGAARLELHVGKTNEAAMQLYRKQGFEEMPYVWLRKTISEAAKEAAARVGEEDEEPPAKDRRPSRSKRSASATRHQHRPRRGGRPDGQKA